MDELTASCPANPPFEDSDMWQEWNMMKSILVDSCKADI